MFDKGIEKAMNGGFKSTLISSILLQIVVVKRKAQGVCDPETLQALQEQVQELQVENLAMKQHTQILHKSFASQVEKVSLQVRKKTTRSLN